MSGLGEKGSDIDGGYMRCIGTWARMSSPFRRIRHNNLTYLLAGWYGAAVLAGRAIVTKQTPFDLSSIVSNDSQRCLKQFQRGVGNNFEGNFIFPNIKHRIKP